MFSQKNPDSAARRWQIGGAADRLFESIKEKSVADYEAMIVGMVQHEAPAAARKLYGQMLAKKLVPSSRTLTYIVLSLVGCSRRTRLTIINGLQMNSSTGWQECKDIITKAASMGVKASSELFEALSALARRTAPAATKVEEIIKVNTY